MFQCKLLMARMVIKCKLPIRYFLLVAFVSLCVWLLCTEHLHSQHVNNKALPHIEEKSSPQYAGSEWDHLGMVYGAEDRQIRNEGYRKHAFNLLISNRIGFHRDIKDTRHRLCQVQKYPNTLPSASIIICFHNEAWSTLLRTIHSILDRTPSHLLHEVILLDDFSGQGDFTTEKLIGYIGNYSKLRLVRTTRREGLIRGRMKGASVATGDVLVFLDSHCEVGYDWLPPLLDRIAGNRSRVVCPIIDIISADTFEYAASPLVRGGFNWGLYFRWDPIPDYLLKTKADFIKPVRSPTMAGGLFAIDRKYFNEIGQYDDGMEIWGGENLEISFRIWMCGGELEIVPCSRVGHVFRKRRPYSSDGKYNSMEVNSMRLAEVWMDEYKEQFYKMRAGLKGKPFGDISARLDLRRKLKCRSFQWFLDNVYPEVKSPGNLNLVYRKKHFNPAILLKGKLHNMAISQCLDTPAKLQDKGDLVTAKSCYFTNSKTVSLNEEDEIKVDGLLCLDVSETSSINGVRLMKCHGQGGSQKWKYSKDKRQLYHPASGLCLHVEFKGTQSFITMEICNNSPQQQWEFTLTFR